ncbi:putative translation protein, beta-barrel domain superfamily [Septoria linicola]|nr:putative translation protein, beta-barrel domain superfamily [Septoria linicola]
MAAPNVSTTAATKLVYQYDESARTHLTRLHAVWRLSDLSQTESELFKAAVAAHDDISSCYVLQTEETIFYVQGGGQPFDTGYMTVNNTKVRIEAVRYDSHGQVLHLAHTSDEIAAHFSAGDMVEQHIDGERRDVNSRTHTAGHIVGLAVRRMVENHRDLDVTELKASHYFDACFVEFKGLIDGKYKAEIQAQASKYVNEALPIKLYWYRPDELSSTNVITAEGMPIVSGADGKVRVVDIIGAGAYPCGGTHVPDTSLVGSIVVRNIKRQKGNTKVSYAIEATS